MAALKAIPEQNVGVGPQAGLRSFLLLMVISTAISSFQERDVGDRTSRKIQLLISAIEDRRPRLFFLANGLPDRFGVSGSWGRSHSFMLSEVGPSPVVASKSS
jgi:hypothetical protein